MRVERPPGGGRRLVIFWPVLVTVVLAALVGALVLVQAQRQGGQVATADRVADDYLSEVAAFRSAVAREVRGVRDTDPGTLRRVVVKAVADPPTLGDAPTYGTERSEAYARATEVERTVLQPYRRLARALARADVALDFVAAARRALRLRVTDLIGATSVTSSAPVRTSVIPAFVRARDTFAKVRVPAGQDALADSVRDALQYVIDEATTLADRLDARQGYSFSYSARFRAAAEAVDGYATTVEGDVAEAVNAVTEDR